MQYVSILRHFPTWLAGLRRVFNTASKAGLGSIGALKDTHEFDVVHTKIRHTDGTR
jgi:hypothetical protein